MVGRDKDKKTLYDVGAIGKVGRWCTRCVCLCQWSIPHETPLKKSNNHPPPL